MVNKYKRKTSQASWDEDVMAKAINDIKEKRGSVNSIATKYNIPRTTLRRHLKSGTSKKKLGRFTTVFTLEQEEELLEYVFHMDQLFFGLSKEEFLQLAFQYAEANQISHPFKNGTAGHDFYKGFIKRHPDLTLRRPEPTSIARARGFNKSQVYRFFDLLESEIAKHHIDAMRIYNMDETGIQSSSNKPPRILTKSGKKQVGLMSSTERGRTTTVISCCNAAGSFVPPLLIFARKRMSPYLLDGAPPGTQATVSDNGWTNGPVFLEWLRFFIETVRPTAEKKVLLVMDNHESHKYYPALELASKNHVIFISLAPHTTHKMQPLDCCVFGPLKTYFDQAISTFQKVHVGRIINQRDIARIFGTAYLRAATTHNAVSGFKTTGLWPPNRLIFDDADFLPATALENLPRAESTTQSVNQQQQKSAVTYESRTPSPSILEQLIEIDTPVIEHTTNLEHIASKNQHFSPSQRQRSITPEIANIVPELDRDLTSDILSAVVVNDNGRVTPSTPVIDITSITPVTKAFDHISDVNECHQSPMALRPVPKMLPNKTCRRRKTQRAEILTSTPIKDEQKDKLAKKQKKVTKLNVSRGLSQKPGSSGIQKAKTRAKTKSKTAANPSENVETSQQYFCLFCIGPYADPPIEDWIQCNDCKLWAHEACTNYSGIGSYYCDSCQEI